MLFIGIGIIYAHFTIHGEVLGFLSKSWFPSVLISLSFLAKNNFELRLFLGFIQQRLLDCSQSRCVSCLRNLAIQFKSACFQQH